MKIRIIKKLTDSVFNVIVYTEDWSEADRKLMVKFGEPEINVGGTIRYISPSDSSDSDPGYEIITLDDAYERVMTESPFTHKFDARDFAGSIDVAKDVANAWALDIERKIASVIRDLRSKDTFFTTEEITEY